MTLAALGTALTGCVTVPVDKPCGVITDPLMGVNATNRDGQRRLDKHFEAGVGAGCWTR